jgi:microcystin-dependent protein
MPQAYVPVTGGRGANAAADFAAGKVMALPKALGRVLGVSGSGTGLTARPLGSTTGEEAHALTAAENGPHQHTGTTNPAGAHYHTGNTDVQGDHQHTDGREGMYNDYGGGNYIGDRNWEYTSSIKYQFWRNSLTSVAGGHWHNLTTTWAADHQHTMTTDVSGSGAAHNNMQPSLFLNAMIKL